MTDISDISLEEIAARRKAGQRRASSLADRRASETALQRPEDGRVRPASPDKKGNVQLNVRVAPDVKNRVIDLARATGNDMSGIVEAALLAYFKGRES
jgi:hypothetical protein